MADYTHGQTGGKRFLPNSPSRRLADKERRLAERAQEYDRALRESQSAATRRRAPSSRAAAITGEPSSSRIHVKLSAPLSAPQTATTTGANIPLGDSTNPFPGDEPQLSQVQSSADVFTSNPIADELTRNGEIHSELGESYADGKVTRDRPSAPMPVSQHEDEQIEDDGMLGLLAQIYGTRAPRML